VVTTREGGVTAQSSFSGIPLSRRLRQSVTQCRQRAYTQYRDPSPVHRPVPVNAAPEFHAQLSENDVVRVLDSRVPPGQGQTVPLHSHRWLGVLYILGWSDFVRRDAPAIAVADSRILGNARQESARGRF
jgi:hypothetical protein